MYSTSAPSTTRADDELGPTEHWVDVHSVTCALCGGLADERETIDLYENDTDLEGEAHKSCWEDHQDNDVAGEEADG